MTKGLGDKVLGWFIVQEGEGDAHAHAHAHADADAKAEAQAKADAGADEESERSARPARGRSAARVVSPVVVPGDTHDARAFASVYRAAGVSDEERDRLSKVLALLDSLPAEASVDVKRAIVAASLEAFGVSIDRILVSGEGALGALDGYVVSGQNRTRDVLGQAEARIAKLESEIQEVRRLMDVQVAAQQELARATTIEKARVRVVLDFFEAGAGLRSVAPVAASMRLVRLK